LNVPSRFTCTHAREVRQRQTPRRPSTLPGGAIPAHVTAIRSGPSRSARRGPGRRRPRRSRPRGEHGSPRPGPRPPCSDARGQVDHDHPAPAATSRRAVADPRPEAPPVTTAAAPLIRTADPPVRRPSPSVRHSASRARR
jgi:hypothetical protein